MDDRHPDLLELDAARAGEADAGVRAHLETCAECRAEVERIEALAARFRPEPLDVPEAMDRAVLAAARLRLRPRLSRFLLPLAAAATLAIAAGLAWHFSTARDPADVDGDGAVDIVDAYRIALHGEGPDLNGDGRTDAADAELLARRIVRLR